MNATTHEPKYATRKDVLSFVSMIATGRLKSAGKIGLQILMSAPLLNRIHLPINQEKETMKTILAVCLSLVICSGCKTLDKIAEVIKEHPSVTNDIPVVIVPPAPTPAPAPVPASGFVFENVKWGGESFASSTTMDMTLKSARVDSKKIYFQLDFNNSWPIKDGSKVGPDGKSYELDLQAVICMFMKRADGTWYGGKWDWIRKGGQTLKLRENIDDGYGAFANEKPTHGQTVAFVFVSIDKRHRSNEAITTWE